MWKMVLEEGEEVRKGRKLGQLYVDKVNGGRMLSKKRIEWLTVIIVERVFNVGQSIRQTNSFTISHQQEETLTQKFIFVYYNKT